MTAHHAEAWGDDAGNFGWQCFTCDQEDDGYKDWLAALVAARAHELAEAAP